MISVVLHKVVNLIKNSYNDSVLCRNVME